MAMRFEMMELARYRMEADGTRQRTKKIRCFWCCRSVAYNQGDSAICVGDDGMPYCCDCAEDMGDIRKRDWFVEMELGGRTDSEADPFDYPFAE